MLAQQVSSPEQGGPVLTFGIRSTLSATDNYNLSPNNTQNATLFDNELSFGYVNRRKIDTLSLQASGVVRANEPPGGSPLFDDRNVGIAYDRVGVNSNLSFGADYSLASVNSLDPFSGDRFDIDDPIIDETDLTLDQGDREEISTRFSFETGVNDPIGFVIDGRYRERDYSGTTDPSLYKSEIFNISATTRFTLSPVTETRVVLRYEDYTAEDAVLTDRETSSINVGLTKALSATDTLDVSLGYQEIALKQTIMGTRQSQTFTGVIGSLDLTRELPRGSIGTSVDLSESVNGRTATWLVTRAMLLPRGSLDISVGATSDVDDTIRPVGSVGFTHQMKRSTLSGSLERQVATSSESSELRTTRALLDYNYEINSISDLGFSASYAEQERIGGIGTASDTTRLDLRATYSRELTRDWQVSSGYEYRQRDETGVGSATSNRVFLTLEREFVVRP